MAQSKFRETDSDPDDYSDDENAKKHIWTFDMEYNEKNSEIILTVDDSVKKGKWQIKLGKKQFDDPSSEYDKLFKFVEKMQDDDFKYYLSKKSGDLKVTLTEKSKQNKIIKRYQWVLEQCKQNPD